MSEEPTAARKCSIMGIRTIAARQDKTFMRIASALFYCVSSFLLIIVNKIILTTYKFPSFELLGIGQLVTTICVLFIGKLLKIIHYPDASLEVVTKIWPLPLFYIGNLVFGLGGTQKISLPMFTVLRRFSILFTMIAENLILGVIPSFAVKFSVFSMIFGAIVAASNDLSFSAVGYTYIGMNNICTASNNVYIKKKLEAKNIGKYGLMFYNSLFMLLPLVLLTYGTHKFKFLNTFPSWTDPIFVTCVAASCCMGFVLNYSVILCTHHNSALTTTIMGVIKNIAVTYIGMAIGGDYIFSWINFTGLNISVIGSIIYTYVTFKPSVKPPPTQEMPESSNPKTNDMPNVRGGL